MHVVKIVVFFEGIPPKDTMTGNVLISPATSRKSRIPSPASSPNLSSRSPYSSPPVIRVGNSASKDPSNHNISLTPPSKQKVYQLPPVNSWVPKGESLFSSILDSRSPQIYRRTNVSSTKTAAFPQSPQPVCQSSRVSWPQDFQAHSNTEISMSDDLQKSQTLDTETNGNAECKSPRLLKKCTSFDQERSKPFPIRSSMTSPMLKRKGISLDETDGVAVSFTLSDSPHTARKSDHPTELLEHDTEELKQDEMSFEVPLCVSTDNQTSDVKTITIVSVHLPDINKNGINETVKFADTSNIQKTQYSDYGDHTESSAITDSKQVDVEKLEQRLERKEIELPKETGAKPKTQKLTGEIIKKTPGKTGASKQKDKFKKHKVGGILKDDTRENSSTIKNLSKDTKKDSTSYSVKSALKSSAAKLKSLGKRNPVTLLSYKSRTITIPDQTCKTRPSSLSSFSQSKSVNKKLVHQSESSPTVLQSVFDDTIKDKPNSKVKRCATADFDLKEDSTDTSSPASSKKSASSSTSTKPCLSQSAAFKTSAQEKSRGKEKMSSISQPKARPVKSPLSQTYCSQKQSAISSKSSTTSVASSSKSAAKSSSLYLRKDSSSLIKEVPAKEDIRKMGEDKRKAKHLKTDSTSNSSNSDSSKNSDCCSCKKTGKKTDGLQGSKKVSEHTDSLQGRKKVSEQTDSLQGGKKLLEKKF